jgi:hypothetical protein
MPRPPRISRPFLGVEDDERWRANQAEAPHRRLTFAGVVGHVRSDDRHALEAGADFQITQHIGFDLAA